MTNAVPLMLPMAASPMVDAADRITLETMLDSLGAKWQREERPDGLLRCVVYFVCGGELHGWWEASSMTPERDITERMVARLDASWRLHIDACKVIGAALRSIDR